MKPNSFTLIELVIVIAILAILAAVVVITMNPAEYMKSARDSARMSDLQTIHSSIGLYQADGKSSMGLANTVYVSLPDSSATCTNLSLPALPAGWSYACSTAANYLKTDGTGWIPIPFSTISFGNIISSLPVDPINSVSSGDYYTYVTGGSYELTAVLESAKYRISGDDDITSKDGGDSFGLYEIGSNLTISPLKDSGLIGYWKFDELSGSTAIDSSGNGNNGTLFSSPTRTTGKISKALSFNGSYVSASSSASLTQFGLSSWIYKTSQDSGHDGIITSNVFRYQVEGNVKPYIQFTVADGDGTCAGAVIPFGVWQHIFVNVNGTAVKIYQDGVLTGNCTVGDGSYNVNALRFGADGLSGIGSMDYMVGKLDDMRVYNSALSVAEIKAIYNSTR
ncbi:MAG: LamG-like jellyroll fold domain-containing protein [Candidatus Paceibacterota bacterium]